MTAIQLNENEYPLFFRNYIKHMGNVNLLAVLKTSFEDVTSTLKDLSEEKLHYRYQEGKWTIKELVQHIIDAERVLSYRALRFSRNDTTDLPGFDEDWYVDSSYGNERNFDTLLNEFFHLRASNIAMFESFTPKTLQLKGTINGSDMSVRALGFIIAGHQMHHLKIIKEKYL